MTISNLSKLQNLLNELFLIDQADLDFGIYRIMGAKREEIQRFLQDDLLPQVRRSLGTLETAEQIDTRAELATAIAGAHAAGIELEQSPKVMLLREKLAQDADPAALEDEVFRICIPFSPLLQRWRFSVVAPL